MSTQDKPSPEKLICRNRKAAGEYFFDRKIEAGLVLMGSEVKMLRLGHGQIAEAYVRIKNDEAFLIGAHIPKYENATHICHEPDQSRKLLLHKREIKKLGQEEKAKGVTLVPLRMYFKGSRVKVEIAVARGKKLHDKRDDIKKRDMDRDLKRVYKLK